MGQAHQAPFVLTWFQTSATKAAKVPSLFYLAKDRFNNMPPQRICIPPFQCSEFASHSLLDRCIFWDTSTRRKVCFTMFQLAGGNVAVYLSSGQLFTVSFTEVTRICAYDSGKILSVLTSMPAIKGRTCCLSLVACVT